STYATQGANTRTYLEGLAAAMGHPADFYYSYRAQAMLDFIYSEVDPTQGAFATAVGKLQNDLNGSGGKVTPTSVDHVERFWILGELFNTDKRTTGYTADNGGMDPAVYCPTDPILYAIDHNVADPQPPPPMTYSLAINNIVNLWYDSASIIRTG